MFPLTHLELGQQFDLQSALEWGSLPQHLSLLSPDAKRDYLRAYTQTYLKEEVWSEQLVRRLEPFRKFLPVAAQCNGLILNASQVARDVGCDIKTVQNYFSILEDTLIGFFLQPYHSSVRKTLAGKPKFYFFDTGVQRALSRLLTVPLLPQTSHYGQVFEHFVILEMVRLNSYLKSDFEFSYIQTKDGAEIDLVVDRPGRPLALVEINSTTQLRADKLRNFLKLADDLPGSRQFILSQDPSPQKFGQARAYQWKEGIQQIFSEST